MSTKKPYRLPVVRSTSRVEILEVIDEETGERFLAPVRIPAGGLIWVRLPMGMRDDEATNKPAEEWELYRVVGRTA